MPDLQFPANCFYLGLHLTFIEDRTSLGVNIKEKAMAIRRAALHISSVAMLIRRAALHISSVAMLIRRAALHTSSVAMLIRRVALHISSVEMAYLQSIRRTSTC